MSTTGDTHMALIFSLVLRWLWIGSLTNSDVHVQWNGKVRMQWSPGMRSVSLVPRNRKRL